MAKLFITELSIKTIPVQETYWHPFYSDDGQLIRYEKLYGPKSLTVNATATFQSSGKFEFTDPEILHKLNELLKEIDF